MKIIRHIIIYILLIAAISACNRFGNVQTGNLDFSNDTVFFDTIFTQIGSTTKNLKLFNNTNKAIKIDKIFLSGGDASKYRLNIDGYPQNSIQDIIIDANDSLYIFVEVTIDPVKDDIIEEDSIIFISGNNQQKVILNAVGKDVYLINGEIIKTQTWTPEKAYLIYNSVLIDSLETLTIEPGVEIFSHRNSYFYVKGTLKAEGTYENPIIFRGDRIDDINYENLPGQWGGIVFLPGSKENYLNYVNINEGFFGIAVDSMINEDIPTLFLNNSEIMNCSYTGLYAVNTYVTVLNSIIADCGVNNIGLFMSGIYNFYHCTISNNYSYSVRNSSAVGLQNFIVNENNQAVYGGFLSAYFVNSIIYGNKKNEFTANAYDTTNSMAFTVQNCLVKLDLEYTDTSANVYQNLVVNEKPYFADLEKFDYHLTDTSQAIIDKGNYEVVNLNLELLKYDKDQTDRLSDGKPDIGAYEFTGSKK